MDTISKVWIMACDELQDDVRNTSPEKKSWMTFCKCMSCTNEISIVDNTLTVENAMKHCMSSFVRPSLYSDVFHNCIVFGNASQPSNMWRNVSGSTGNQKTVKRDFCVFLHTPQL